MNVSQFYRSIRRERAYVFAVLFWTMRERAWYILLAMVFMFLTMMLVVLVPVRLEW